MKAFYSVLAGVVLVSGVTIWVLATRQAEPASVPPLRSSEAVPEPAVPVEPQRRATAGAAPDAAGELPSAAMAEQTAPRGPDLGSPLPRDPALAREVIARLSLSQDAGQVPALARFLEHPAEEVRVAAVQGLVLLGEMAAVPYLRNAAARSETALPGEAALMRNAAELLARGAEPLMRGPIAVPDPATRETLELPPEAASPSEP